MKVIRPSKNTINQGFSSKHAAYDFSGLNQPDEVMAGMDGEIIERTDLYVNSWRNTGKLTTRDYGNYIKVRHTDGSYALFAHLKKGSSYVVGTKVKAGEVIARIGNTGNSTGPHLHVEYRTSGNINTSVTFTETMTDPLQECLIAHEKAMGAVEDRDTQIKDLKKQIEDLKATEKRLITEKDKIVKEKDEVIEVMGEKAKQDVELYDKEIKQLQLERSIAIGLIKSAEDKINKLNEKVGKLELDLLSAQKELAGVSDTPTTPIPYKKLYDECVLDNQKLTEVTMPKATKSYLLKLQELILEFDKLLK